MTATTVLVHEFVEFIPSDLQPGVLYISMAYATAAHRCCCGCGKEVVTPLTPTDWQMTFDGETVSLSPSVGNWSFPCQSHYWVRRNKVQWAPKWSREQIDAGRTRDRDAKDRFFAHEDTPQEDVALAPAAASQDLPEATSALRRWWQRARSWLASLRG